MVLDGALLQSYELSGCGSRHKSSSKVHPGLFAWSPLAAHHRRRHGAFNWLQRKDRLPGATSGRLRLLPITFWRQGYASEFLGSIPFSKEHIRP